MRNSMAERKTKIYFVCAGCHALASSYDPRPLACSPECLSLASTESAAKDQRKRAGQFQIEVSLLPRFEALKLIPHLADAAATGAISWNHANELFTLSIWQAVARSGGDGSIPEGRTMPTRFDE